MRHAVFGFSTPNLGDDVQALAAALLLPSIDAYLDRDALDKVILPEPHRVIMNSWFAIKRYKAVPSDSIMPLYFGQCVGRPELLNSTWVTEWKNRQPIGCRDLHSVKSLQDLGISAFFTGCLTTWMGRFFEPPAKREGIFFVDLPEAMERFVPERIRKNARRITNATADGAGNQIERFRRTAEICDLVRTAEMVVTRRLHTALPCVGFTTPVTVYLEGDEKNRRRFSGSDRFLPMIFHDGKHPTGNIDWIEPTPVSIPAEMEDHFSVLAKQLSVVIKPRYESVMEFVETLPDLRRYPR